MSLMNAVPGKCDTFICYRRVNGCTTAKDIFNWMQAHRDYDFGYVYFSDSRPDANFLNDIETYIPIAKNFIIVMTDDFTDGFPETLEEFEQQRRVDATNTIVTAQEVTQIMNRMRPHYGKTDEDTPRIIRVDAGRVDHVPSEPFVRLASGYSDSQRDTELTKYLVRCFTTAAAHVIPRRGVGVTDISMDCERVFPTIAVPTHITLREQAVKEHLQKYSDFTFTVYDQKLAVSETGDTLFLSELAEQLIRMPLSPQNGKYRVATISGNSGMGKTTQLLKLCRNHNQSRTSPRVPPYFYLPAHELDFYTSHTEVFYTAFLVHCGYDPNEHPHTKAYVTKHILGDPFPDGQAPCVVMIDAIDEVESSENVNKISQAVAELAQMGVAVIVTSRGEAPLSNSVISNCLQAKMQKLENTIENLPPAYRPTPQSPLTKLLSTPIYFTMYKIAVDGSDDRGSIAELQGQLEENYFHYKNPTTPGELIWNYIMRHIAKCHGNNTRREISELNSWFFLFYILPRIAVQMGTAKVSKNEISEDALKTVYKNALDSFCVWDPFWNGDGHLQITRSSFPGATLPDYRCFEAFCSRTFPLLVKSGNLRNTVYKFSHAIIFEFFKALDMVNGICALAHSGSFDYPTEAVCQNNAVRRLSDTHLPYHCAQFVGEICGERYNIPSFSPEENTWVSHRQPTHEILHLALDKLRSNGSLSTPGLINNLFTILKSARAIGDTTPDMSDIDFSGIDLSRCSLINIIFSHADPFTPEKKLCANFRNAKLDNTISFSGGHRSHVHNLAVMAMYEWRPNRLISIDEVGCCVLWDTDYELPLCVRHLRPAAGKAVISNIVEDAQKRLWVACDNMLYCLMMVSGDGHFEVASSQILPTRSVSQIGIHPNTGELYYHPSDTPLDRFHLDGTPYAPVTGKWLQNTVVSRDGSKAYTLSYIGRSKCPLSGSENEATACSGRYFCTQTYELYGNWLPMCVPGQIYTGPRKASIPDDRQSKNNFNQLNLQSVVEIGKWEMDENQTWQYRGTVLTSEQLSAFTGYDFFSHGHIFLDERRGKQMLVVSLRCQTNKRYLQRQSVNGIVLLYDLERNELFKKYILPDNRGLHCVYPGSSSIYCASYLTIFRSDRLGETHLFSSGEGMLNAVQFLPDTRSFVAVTTAPVRIQVFSCDALPEWKCVCQIVPTLGGKDMMQFQTASLAFRFGGGLTFTRPEHMEHPDRLQLVLCDKKKRMSVVHFATGQAQQDMSNDIFLINNPQVSFFEEGNCKFRLRISGNSVKLQPFSTGTSPLPRVDVHSQWLFAGCDFSGAEFEGEGAPADLLHYASVSTVIPMEAELEPDADDDGLYSLYDDDEEDCV